MILLDTSVLVDALSGPRRSAAALRRAGPVEAEIAANLYREVSGARGLEIDLAIAAGAIAWEATLWTLYVEDFEDLPSLVVKRPGYPRTALGTAGPGSP